MLINPATRLNQASLLPVDQFQLPLSLLFLLPEIMSPSGKSWAALSSPHLCSSLLTILLTALLHYQLLFTDGLSPPELFPRVYIK